MNEIKMETIRELVDVVAVSGMTLMVVHPYFTVTAANGDVLGDFSTQEKAEEFLVSQ